MNREFVKKMLQAKQIEYEAIKEILPDNLRRKVDTMESDAIELIKEVTFDFFRDSADENNDKAAKKSSDTGKYSDKKKSSRKINVDFM